MIHSSGSREVEATLRAVQSTQRRVLVFGGARGIGAAVAKAFADGGDKVAIAARTQAQVDETAKAIGAEGHVADVSDPASVASVFEAFAAPDVVVHAAAVQGGAGAIGPIWDTDPKAFAQVVDINLTGSYYVLREALRAMRARGTGVVVMFSGGGSVFPRAGFDAYGATKTGVLRLVESAQVALDEEGSKVRLHAIAPGAVKTAMTEEVLTLAQKVPGEAQAAQKVADGDGVPPTMAADLCQFFATDAAAKLKGRLVHVKEPYREYVERDLDDAAGKLRRHDYQS